MFVLMISRSSLKLGHLGSKTRSPGQIKGNPCLHSRGFMSEVIIMNLAQNVCLYDIQEKFGTWSLMTDISRSIDFLNFFHLGQFLSNYWS